MCIHSFVPLPSAIFHRRLLSNSTLDEDQPLMWLVVVHFICPMVSSIPHYCTEPLFHHLSQFVLKMEHFRYVQVDNHMQKYGQERFLVLFFFFA